MIKKIVITTAIMLSLASTAEITDSQFKYSPDLEYKNYKEKIHHVKLGDVRKDFIKEINYIGEKWYLIEQKGHLSYYVQKDPLSYKVSRVRIVYPYSDFETGRDLKHLSEFYGEPKYVSDDARFFNGEIRIRMYISEDVLTPDLDYNQTVIDILNYKINEEKLESEDIIYNSSRMIRH